MWGTVEGPEDTVILKKYSFGTYLLLGGKDKRGVCKQKENIRACSRSTVKFLKRKANNANRWC